MKNLLLLFPPFFGGRVADPRVLDALLPAFLSFSFAASCTYIINDIVDRHADRNHATKKNRPIARGDVEVWYAAVLAGVLYVAAMFLASQISEHFIGYLVLYILTSVFYSFFFKNIVLIDIFALSTGYILRVMAGGEAFRVPVSNWLFLTVFVVALFLAAGKRLGEMTALGDDAGKHRKNLADYTLSFLEGVQWFSASVALVTYTLYTIENNSKMFYTFPVAIFGFLRYIYLVKKGISDPTEVLLKDRQMVLTGAAWAVAVGISIYA